MLDLCQDCGHDAHESWGCSGQPGTDEPFHCGCETMWTDAQAEAQLAEDRRIIEDEQNTRARYVGIGPRLGV